jgi:alpha-mannosidase
MTIGDLNRDTFRSPLPIENGHLFAYAFNNYWFTNYKAAQGGDLMFRYSLTTTKKYDPAAASRFGQSVRTPMLARVCEPSKDARGSVPGGFCEVSPSNVVIQAVKQAESGDGWIVRLRELSGRNTEAVLALKPRKFKEAWSCNLVEDTQTKLAISLDRVKVKLPAHGLATVLLR